MGSGQTARQRQREPEWEGMGARARATGTVCFLVSWKPLIPCPRGSAIAATSWLGNIFRGRGQGVETKEI